MKRLLTRAANIALLISAAGNNAGGQTNAMCTTVLHANGTTGTLFEPCKTLSRRIVFENAKVKAAVDEILKPDAVAVSSVFSQRDLQSQQPQKPSLAGTPAQGQAIPSVQPAGAAAGTVAMVGTKAGDDAIAALGVNPALFFLSDLASKAMTQYSRFSDVTLFVPVTNQTATSANEPANSKLKYIGVRARFNWTGLSAGEAVWDGAKAAIAKFMTAQDRAVTRVSDILEEAHDPALCATRMLTNASDDDILEACGKLPTFDFSLDEAAAARRELAAVRRAADANFFGADIRMDFGDPTLGATPNAAGKFLYAGLAWGERFGASGTTLGLQFRAGARHARLDTDTTAEFAIEGGFGFELARSIDDQELSASLALEGRHGNAPANETDRFQTNFAMIRGSFLLPVTAGNSVSVNFGVPISGPATPTLSVNFNWGLLLSDGRTK